MTSCPPPGFDRVIREIRRAENKRMRLDKAAIRSACAKANPVYKDKGKSDDIVRFLANNGVLLDDDGVFVFDGARADHVLGSIEQGCMPDPALPPSVRIAAV
ncbi:hypothetical protein L0Y59_01370, partial [Candidatus Uhrbacteria bacterium]|nr:hypothetical protein [Candidatus Uhrbacteria bacterium]